MAIYPARAKVERFWSVGVAEHPGQATKSRCLAALAKGLNPDAPAGTTVDRGREVKRPVPRRRRRAVAFAFAVDTFGNDPARGQQGVDPWPLTKKLIG